MYILGNLHYKGDTSFVHIDPPAEIFTLSTWSVIGAGVVGTQPGPAASMQASSLAILDSCWFTHQQPGGEMRRWGGGGWMDSRVTIAPSSTVAQGRWSESWSARLQSEGSWRLRYPQAFPFSSSVLAHPCPRSPKGLPFPWTYVEWRGEVFGYAESIIWWGKKKKTDQRGLGCRSLCRPLGWGLANTAKC